MRIVVSVILIWLIGNLVPYAIVGKYWGAVWYRLNIPLSYFVEKSFGIGPGTVGTIALVTVSNSVIYGIFLWFIVKAFVVLVERESREL
jgi:hypothetical protein